MRGGVYKSSMVLVNSDDGLIYTEEIDKNLQICITWTEKPQNGAKVLENMQQHRKRLKIRLLNSVTTRFSYLVHFFFPL